MKGLYVHTAHATARFRADHSLWHVLVPEAVVAAEHAGFSVVRPPEASITWGRTAGDLLAAHISVAVEW